MLVVRPLQSSCGGTSTWMRKETKYSLLHHTGFRSDNPRRKACYKTAMQVKLSPHYFSDVPMQDNSGSEMSRFDDLNTSPRNTPYYTTLKEPDSV